MHASEDNHMNTYQSHVIEDPAQVTWKGFTLSIFAGLMFAWLCINWITDCGQVTRTVDGTYLKGECVLVPWVNPNIYDHYVE